MALPLARLTQTGGRRLALTIGYSVGVIGALLTIFGGANRILFFMLLGAFFVGAASASGYQARFAAIDLATSENSSKNLSYVVWGSTIGAVTGPNLMEPSGVFAASLGLPELVGPYLIAALTLFLSVIVIQLFLRPDPYLTANKTAEGSLAKKRETTRSALAHIREYPLALFAIASVAIGHLAMVSIRL
jgi:MFS family permease